MRIISGKFKGVNLNFLKSQTTRQLKDSVKENIFNILSHSNNLKIKIEKATILDLFSGIGSFGLESLSRGAKNVTFVEQDQKAIKVLEKNLAVLSITKKANIHNVTIDNFLKLHKDNKYNIFFCDPPFSDRKYLENLKIIKRKNYFTKDHVVIIHREKNTEDDFEHFLKILFTKIYGRSKIIFGIFN